MQDRSTAVEKAIVLNAARPVVVCPQSHVRVEPTSTATSGRTPVRSPSVRQTFVVPEADVDRVVKIRVVRQLAVDLAEKTPAVHQ